MISQWFTFALFKDKNNVYKLIHEKNLLSISY